MTPDECAELNDAVAELSAEDTAAPVQRIRVLPAAESCIAVGLKSARLREDWLAFENYVVAASLRPHSEMSAVLCEVLIERHEDINNEDIVEVLGIIADPTSVPALVDAIVWAPPRDEFRSLALKAVEALAGIRTPEARAALEGFAETGSVEIRQAADEVLAVLRR